MQAPPPFAAAADDAERRSDGTGLERHAPLCGEVQRLSERLAVLEDALVREGLIAEFRP